MNLPYVLLKRPFGKLLTYSYNSEHTHTQSTHIMSWGWVDWSYHSKDTGIDRDM